MSTRAELLEKLAKAIDERYKASAAWRKADNVRTKADKDRDKALADWHEENARIAMITADMDKEVT